ncbi:beta family protein [Pseudomonas plecoglossicida]|uniref:beta family protein n=1 Tax=Pseudomonas TaxID=286 RepID=UPI000760E637|nr:MULTISPECIES: beta family protein [Pseudomonas]MDQ7965333.1 beta family protein [Pseudomonas plecoglossicida]WFG03471.1 beta family protein [Pseudomonas putida]
MDWNSLIYFPVLKTKDAELRAISAVDVLYRRKMLPVYEITKSRITKKNSFGDILKRLDQIKNIQGDMPYILDVTTDEKQKNEQTESILCPANGYESWRIWLDLNCGQNIVPVIHINYELDEDLNEAKSFVSSVTNKYKKMALRLPAHLDAEEYEEIISIVASELKGSRLYVLLDEGCIREKVKDDGLAAVAGAYQRAFDTISRMPNSQEWLERVVCVAGSFPYQVAQEGKGDAYGKFEIYEHSLFVSLKHNRPSLQFGDFASINVKQIEMRGGTFVPRIDFGTDTTFYYYRKRRDAGSYVLCAKQVLVDPMYSTNHSWGDAEIDSASKNTPSGISPSFWISVRACNYMIRRVKLLSA